MSVHSYCHTCLTNVGVETDPHKFWCPEIGRDREHELDAGLHAYIASLESENRRLTQLIEDMREPLP